MASFLFPLFPNHTCYVEPFCGAAALFFMKEPSEVEVLNDINSDLVNLYRVVKYHLEELYKQFKWTLASRQNFQWLLDTKPETITDVQRAGRFLYLQKMAFGSKIEGQSFGTSATSGPRFNIFSLEQDLSDTHFRLSQTLIENLPWERIIEKYDRPETLFYCDPPYWQTEGYGVEFPFDNYQRLADYAKTIKGKMIISINDHPQIKALFDDMPRREVDYQYTVGCRSKPCQAVEMIYANFDLDEEYSRQVQQEEFDL